MVDEAGNEGGVEALAGNVSHALRGFRGRLKDAIGTRSVRKVAEAIDASEGSLRNYLRGDTYPDLKVAERLAAELRVTFPWLTYGAGGKTLDGPGLPAANDFVQIPVYDVEAAAGPGAALTDERIISQVMFRKDFLSQERLNPASLGMISARGDSMPISAPDGALLLVDTSVRSIHADAIYVLRLDHHLLVKRLQRLVDGAIDVISENPAYRTERIEAGRVGDLDVVGQVKLSSHRV